MSGQRPLKYLIVYGPTQEPFDPVRYLTNRSTGTMGRLLVQAARRSGHRVTAIQCPDQARTARDLLRQLRSLIGRHDVFIMAAAVCDVRPARVSGSKIKKEALQTVRFVKNPDILRELRKRKTKNQAFVGFALESHALDRNAHKKLISKGLDLIVGQKVSQKIDPFGPVSMDVLLLTPDGERKAYARITKTALARILVSCGEFLARQKASKKA
ncbi:MAG: Coenzyme A biosynthesis bifunctional protein CoaBC [Candidatus Omnitrophica bacterium]|nr:Coenzyme A biosynthesis bifunctional protein CoaBC [Candidatus Omnitrophota bacterium]